MDFIPLVAETLGGLAKDTISTVRLIGKVLGQRVNPSDPSTSTKHLFGRLAIALWRGNVAPPCCSLPRWTNLIFFVVVLVLIICLLRCIVFSLHIMLTSRSRLVWRSLTIRAMRSANSQATPWHQTSSRSRARARVDIMSRAVWRAREALGCSCFNMNYRVYYAELAHECT